MHLRTRQTERTMTAEISDNPQSQSTKNIPLWAGILIVLLFLGGVTVLVLWMSRHKGGPGTHLNANAQRAEVAGGSVVDAGGGEYRATLSTASLFASKFKDGYTVNLAYILNERPLLQEEEIQPMNARRRILANTTAASQILHVTPDQIKKLQSSDFKLLDRIQFAQNLHIPVKLTDGDKAHLSDLVVRYSKADKDARPAAQTKLLEAVYEIKEQHLTEMEASLRSTISQIPRVLNLSQIIDSNKLPQPQRWPRGLPTTQQIQRLAAATRAAATQAAATQPSTQPVVTEALGTTRPASTQPLP